MAAFPQFEELNSCEYLFLRTISEPADNQLRLIIAEASPGGEVSVETRNALGLPDTLLRDARVIESTAGDRLFELTWSSYIAYSVRDESFVSADDYEILESGRLVCLYAKSHFLDYISKATFASAVYPGPYRHIGINCQNHIVDVISTADPEIRQLRQLPGKIQ